MRVTTENRPAGGWVRDLAAELAGDTAVTVERAATAEGELVLRRRGRHYEIISNGMFLMDTRDGRSERLLVDAAVQDQAGSVTVLIGGLGVGFSLAAALAYDRVRAVTVVEREPEVVGWHATHLAAFSGGGLDDPRVDLVQADLVPWIRQSADRYDAICLDIDNGPDWTVSPGNADLYDDAGLTAIGRRLRPGGVLTLWSAHPVPQFGQRLQRHFDAVGTLPVDARRGQPDVVYRARLAR